MKPGLFFILLALVVILAYVMFSTESATPGSAASSSGSSPGQGEQVLPHKTSKPVVYMTPDGRPTSVPPPSPAQPDAMPPSTLPPAPTAPMLTPGTMTLRDPIIPPDTSQTARARTSLVPDHDIINPINIELYPTYSAVGIEVEYNNDMNNNGSAEFFWRVQGEQRWRRGVEMSIDRERKFIRASMWPLDQNKTIEVYLAFRDADVPEVKTRLVTTTTRRIVLENAGGRAIFVSPRGDDRGQGTRQSPLRTLAKAASGARPGDTIYADSGVYYETELFSNLKGQPGRPIIITAAPGEQPIIDGSTPVRPNTRAWRAVQGDIFELTEAPPVEPAYVAQDGKRMYAYNSLAELAADKTASRRAWFYDRSAKKLYVRTGTRLPASAYTYNIAASRNGIRFDNSQHVVVRGFTIRYCGEAGVRFSNGAVANVLIDNTIHNAINGVFAKDTSTQDNAIWRNHIYEPGLEDFTWDAIKYSSYGRQGINFHQAGRGNSVCYNRVDRFFDGVVALSWKNPYGFQFNRDMDIMFNEFTNMGDDALEPDGGGVNMRIHGNRIRDCFVAISLAPVERGPVYVTRNDATFSFIMFKLNVGGCTSLGDTYVWHNSGYAISRSGGHGMISMTDTIPMQNKHFRNNAIIGHGESVRQGSTGNTVDYNCYWHTPGGRPRSFSWDGRSFPTIEAFAKATGQEQHGLYADPQFTSTPGLGDAPGSDFTQSRASDRSLATDASAGDLRPRATSPLLNAGVIIRGFNEDFSGTAPDIGAYEFGM